MTTGDISEPIVGFNVLKEIICNPYEYGMTFEDLPKLLGLSMPSAKDVSAVIDLISEKTSVP